MQPNIHWLARRIVEEGEDFPLPEIVVGCFGGHEAAPFFFSASQHREETDKTEKIRTSADVIALE